MSYEAKFWSRVEVKESGCWEWQGSRSVDGYGSINRGKGGRFLVHRFAYEFYFGAIKQPFVLHKCDNPPCCRPDHLFEGDNAANMQDCSTKGRLIIPHPTGSNHPRAKINESDVLRIREIYLATKSYAEIKKIYSISDGTISSLLRRKTWKHV